ncbi:MAG: PQQ-binding-like beta-propeller repeat protein, partial [Candidatus Poseidoniia archaeon]|nr:PQQ-binding-like beta-propeller repeat protein [Candidatus Poseidoniia archaeon]
LWSYQTGSIVYSVAISADGEYITAGSWDNRVYLFDKDSSTPLWNYDAGDAVYSVAISANGEYITAGSWDNKKVYLFDKGSSTPLWSTGSWESNTDLSDADASFWGEDANDYSGYTVSGAGDVNGDGYDDFIIGAYGDDNGGNNAGQTYLILGGGSPLMKVANDITSL